MTNRTAQVARILLRADRPLSARDIAARLGYEKRDIYSAVHSLAATGAIKLVGLDGKRQTFVRADGKQLNRHLAGVHGRKTKPKTATGRPLIVSLPPDFSPLAFCLGGFTFRLPALGRLSAARVVPGAF